MEFPNEKEERRRRRRRRRRRGAPPRGLVAKTWSDQNINFAVSGGAVINRR